MVGYRIGSTMDVLWACFEVLFYELQFDAAVRKRIEQGDKRPRKEIWQDVATEYDALNA